ncbi:MAG: HK97 family phage prohead protease [Paracoccaceae bacterium]
MERRFLSINDCPVGLETREDNSRLITGHAAVYYDGSKSTEYELWRGAVERIMPGAFDRAIGDNGDDVRALFNHDPDHLLGRTGAKTLMLSSDDKGLRYEIDPPDTNIGRDVMASIERRDLTGSSFSFIVLEETWRKDDDANLEIREVNDVQLFDVCPVTFPAYAATTADSRDAETHESYQRWRDTQKKRIDALLSQYKIRARKIEISS